MKLHNTHKRLPRPYTGNFGLKEKEKVKVTVRKKGENKPKRNVREGKKLKNGLRKKYRKHMHKITRDTGRKDTVIVVCQETKLGYYGMLMLD